MTTRDEIDRTEQLKARPDWPEVAKVGDALPGQWVTLTRYGARVQVTGHVGGRYTHIRPADHEALQGLLRCCPHSIDARTEAVSAPQEVADGE